jgi:hypothetical protein
MRPKFRTSVITGADWPRSKKPQALASCGYPGSKMDCVRKSYPAPVREAKATFGQT